MSYLEKNADYSRNQRFLECVVAAGLRLHGRCLAGGRVLCKVQESRLVLWQFWLAVEDVAIVPTFSV